MKYVRTDVRTCLNGELRNQMGEIDARLHKPPCPNKKISFLDMHESDIVDKFRDEFKAFQNKDRPFNSEAKWAAQDVVEGRSHLWHEKYSLYYTQKLGYVACLDTSMLCGIGPAERSWAAVKS